MYHKQLQFFHKILLSHLFCLHLSDAGLILSLFQTLPDNIHSLKYQLHIIPVDFLIAKLVDHFCIICVTQPLVFFIRILCYKGKKCQWETLNLGLLLILVCRVRFIVEGVQWLQLGCAQAWNGLLSCLRESLSNVQKCPRVHQWKRGHSDLPWPYFVGA